MPKRKNRIEWGLGKYHICMVCGKRFYVEASQSDTWVYKTNKGFCCSYSCYKKR